MNRILLNTICLTVSIIMIIGCTQDSDIEIPDSDKTLVVHSVLHPDTSVFRVRCSVNKHPEPTQNKRQNWQPMRLMIFSRGFPTSQRMVSQRRNNSRQKRSSVAKSLSCSSNCSNITTHLYNKVSLTPISWNRRPTLVTPWVTSILGWATTNVRSRLLNCV